MVKPHLKIIKILVLNEDIKRLMRIMIFLTKVDQIEARCIEIDGTFLFLGLKFILCKFSSIIFYRLKDLYIRFIYMFLLYICYRRFIFNKIVEKEHAYND